MNKFLSLLIVAVVVVFFSACKDKPQEEARKPVSTKVVQETKPDSLAIDSAKAVAPPKVVVKQAPKAPDKYFLIAGSFQSRANAETFKAKLEKEGYTSSIIERASGPNTDFYKVSYMSFSDRKLAYAELRKARQMEGQDNVWLLIKR